MCCSYKTYTGFWRCSTMKECKIPYSESLLNICQNDNILNVLAWIRCIIKINVTFIGFLKCEN